MAVGIQKLPEGQQKMLQFKQFHQIKRMMAASDNRITALERVRFADITLDPTLERGEWRYLTESEIASLTRALSDRD